ncbi:MAG: 3-isopropylmalate dehydratase small subunit [Candidatus Marsarchaeota archaeon]|jgi:3-isopropylmalate/(R)-2-methylmalate dehydratase small subunit|nr:3-isopropylmalate dehydratase small subunit [Candidatus Marsarchaeota archaeon]
MDTIIKEIVGRALPLRGNDIDTDRIVPARFLKEITFSRMGEYAFYDERFGDSGEKKEHPFNNPAYAGASILIVNKNFGCGSSREHAPQAIKRFGIRAIIGESFATIFSGNSFAIGMPLLRVSAEDAEYLLKAVEENKSAELRISLPDKSITLNGRAIGFSIPEAELNAFVTGRWDSLSLLLANAEKAKQLEAGLKYPNRFGAVHDSGGAQAYG